MFVTPFLPITDCADCSYERQRFISARVYFALACVNFFFVTITSIIYFRRAYLSSGMRQRIKHDQGREGPTLEDRMNYHTLGQRSFFGLIMRTAGHLILSTTVLCTQSFSRASCELFMWGTMIGYYTWMFGLCWSSYRLYHLIRINRMKKSYAQRSLQHEWEAWFIRHCHAVDARHGLLPYCIILIVGVTTVAMVEVVTMIRDGAHCIYSWGSYVMVVLDVVFVIVVVPFSVWHVFKYKDLHGIRASILTQCIIGVPCIIMYFVWTAALEPPNTEHPSMPRVMFAPGNWILIMTTTGHIMYIVVPLFRRPHYYVSARQRSLSLSRPIATTNTTTLSHDTGANTNPSTTGHYRVELSAESLRNALNDPESADALLQLATKDFSAENVLFYMEYLRLAKKDTLQWSECLELYKTYIPDTAPLQINITGKTRKELEAAMSNLNKVPSNPCEGSSSNPYKNQQLQQRQELVSISIFDGCSEEVFWNIFTSVFPKFVQDHQNPFP